MVKQEITQELLLLNGFQPSQVNSGDSNYVLLTYIDNNSSFQVRLQSTEFSHNGSVIPDLATLDSLFSISTGKRLDMNLSPTKNFIYGTSQIEYSPSHAMHYLTLELTDHPQNWAALNNRGLCKHKIALQKNDSKLLKDAIADFENAISLVKYDGGYPIAELNLQNAKSDLDRLENKII